MKTFLTISLGLVLPFLLLLPQTGYAQNFVYTPRDPAFGGSPLNYQWLISSAKAQNPFKSTTSFDFNQNPLENFKSSLQRQVLRGLTQQIIQDRFGDINLTKQSSYQFGEFDISILPGPSGIQIHINDNSTGKGTTITIPNF